MSSSSSVTKWSAEAIEEAIQLALVKSNSIMIPEEFLNLIGLDDPYKQMSTFWRYLDSNRKIIVDKSALMWLGYNGTVNNQKSRSGVY